MKLELSVREVLREKRREGYCLRSDVLSQS
jgi:hypothetical protein